MEMSKNQRIIAFHPTIATYRIDFFNALATRANCKIYLLMRVFTNFVDYESIRKKIEFDPQYVFDERKEHIRSFSLRYWRILDKEDPDVVITFEFGSCPIMIILHRIIKRKKYKIITMCDDSPRIFDRGSIRHRLCRAICSPFLDDIIFSSKEISDRYKRKKGIGIYFPIIREENKARNTYKSILEHSNSLALKYQLSEHRVIGFVGRLAKEKNVGALIRCFSKIKTTNESLVIIGDGPERNSLEELSKELGVEAIFTGRIEGDELYSWYNIIDIFVLPSTYEPFGAVTNEALLAGCVAVVSDRCGSKCLISNYHNGLIYNAEDENNLSDAIVKARQFAQQHDKEISLRANLMEEDFSQLFNSLIRSL